MAAPTTSLITCNVINVDFLVQNYCVLCYSVLAELAEFGPDVEYRSSRLAYMSPGLVVVWINCLLANLSFGQVVALHLWPSRRLAELSLADLSYTPSHCSRRPHALCLVYGGEIPRDAVRTRRDLSMPERRQ